MSNICPHCGVSINLTDPYRTAPPKKPEPKKEVPKKPRWYEEMNWRNFFSNLWGYTINVFMTIVVITAVGGGLYCLVKWASSPDKVDYCYVDGSTHTANSWVLKGHVPWGQDRHFGSFSETYLAQKYAQKINCPLDITPADEVDSAIVPNVPTPTVTGSGPFMAYPAPIQPAPSASVPELLP